MMKMLKYMIAATFSAAIPHGAPAQNVPQSAQPPLDSAPADAPAAQPIKPLAGDIVYDKVGEQIGTIASTTDQQVVVTTPRGKITIPVASLFTGAKGLAINMTRGEVDAAIQSAH